MRENFKKGISALAAVCVIGTLFTGVAFAKNIKGDNRQSGKPEFKKVELTEEQKAEMKEKFKAKLDEQVKAGKITQEQADKMLENFGTRKLPPMGGGFKGQRPALTEEQKAEMKEKMKVKLDEEVKAGKITQEEADKRLADFDAGKMPMQRGFQGQKPALTEEQKAEMKEKMKVKLDEEVKAGKITQDEADKILANCDKMPMGPRVRGEKPAPTEEQKAEMKENLKVKLDEAVKAGKITQDEADKRLADFDAGKMPMQREFKGQRPALTEEQKAEMKEKMKARLDQMVKEGKITQDEADKKLAAFDSIENVEIKDNQLRIRGEKRDGTKAETRDKAKNVKSDKNA